MCVNRIARAIARKMPLVFAILVVSFSTALGQKDNKQQPAGPLITRTTTRHENYRIGFGGTVTIVGAPAGSISIEGWQKNEIDISATIELQGPNAAAIDQLAVLNTFAVDVDVNHIRILTSGTHDREFMKHAAKNFPKTLIGLPWKLDFQIKMPALSDLEIDAGAGPISLTGVEGALRLNAMKSDANLTLTGGLVSVLVQSGSINLIIPARSWHGLGAEWRLASGNLNIELMSGFSADINADVLHAGQIQSSIPELHPIEGSSVSQHSLRARVANGGATLNFTVGDGNIVIKQAGQ